MARDILVTVRGKQINQKEPEDTNTSEIVTNGKFHSKDENFFICYSTIEEDKSFTNNLIKVEKKKKKKKKRINKFKNGVQKRPKKFNKLCNHFWNYRN